MSEIIDILPDDYQDDFLEAYRNGTLETGLKIDCDLDDNLVFKRGQFNLFLGHDNVGKTFFILWYMVVLSIKHGIRWTVYCSENRAWSIKSKIISFHGCENMRQMEDEKYIKAKSWMSNHFNFVNTINNYTAEQLIKVFEKQDSDALTVLFSVCDAPT